MSKTKPLFKKIAPGLEICLFSGLEQNFPPHFHNHYLIGCVLDGKRRMTLAGRECWPGPGDIVLLNPEEVHGCVQAGEKPLYWLGLHFSPDCMKNMATDIAGQYSLPLFKKANWPESPLAADFRAMAGQMSASPNCLQGLARKILGKILFWNRDLAAPVGECASKNPFDELRAHLKANPPASVSLDEMSALARLDKYSLVRGFNTCYGITPWRYLEALRVNLGQQMLGEGKKIAEVAINCGFTDQSHFSRCFKARTGITPGEYKKSSLPAQDFSNPIGSKTLQGFTSCAWEEVETPPRLTASV